MVLGIAYDLDATTVGCDLVTLGHVVAGVIGSLHLNVGLDLADEGANVGLVEDYDGIDALEGGDDLGALLLGHGGTSGTFKAAYTLVGVDGDDEFAAERFGSAQITYMADVEEIEAAVGEGHGMALGAPTGDYFG